MKRTFCLYLASFLLCACGGSVRLERVPGAAGSGNSAGGQSNSGASSAGSGGSSAEECGVIEYCYAGCSVQKEQSFPECKDGKWHCSEGSSLLSACPPTPCSQAVCCDPFTGQTSPGVCDASGTLARCEAGLEPRTAAPNCVELPEVCKVASYEDLEGTECELDGPQCSFGHCSYVCDCMALPNETPRWSCGELQC